MLSVVKLSFYRRILSCSGQQISTLPKKKDKSKKPAYGYNEFERDTKLLSNLPLRKAETKILKKDVELVQYIQDFKDTQDTQELLVLPKPAVKKSIKGVEGVSKKKTIVYKSMGKSGKNDNGKAYLTKGKEKVDPTGYRKVIEERLLVERELVKQNAVARCLKVFENYRINEGFLENVMKYPLHPESLLAENCSGNLFDKIEFKISGEQLFNQINPEAILIPSSFPAVTTVLDIAASDEKRKNLLNWQIDQIEKLGFDGFEKHQTEIKRRGTDFHRAVETLVARNELDESQLDLQILKSVQAIKKKLLEGEFRDEMVLIEAKMFHSGLMYKGRMDCMGYYKDSLCLIDWKRSDKAKRNLNSLYDAPAQTSAYIGAFLNDPNFRELREKHKLKNALIVNVCENGEINMHELNFQQVEFYWYQWLNMLGTFWNNVMQQKEN